MDPGIDCRITGQESQGGGRRTEGKQSQALGGGNPGKRRCSTQSMWHPREDEENDSDNQPPPLRRKAVSQPQAAGTEFQGETESAASSQHRPLHPSRSHSLQPGTRRILIWTFSLISRNSQVHKQTPPFLFETFLQREGRLLETRRTFQDSPQALSTSGLPEDVRQHPEPVEPGPLMTQ